jgi:hypothetical protein
MSIQYSENYTSINTISATATSEVYDVSKRQLVSIQFLCNTYSSGNGVFTINASNDGINYYPISFLDASATAVGTQVTSKTLSSASTGSNTAIAIVNPSFRYLTVTTTITGTGTYSFTLEAKG